MNTTPTLNNPHALLELPSGHVLISDTGNHALRTLAPELTYLSTVAICDRARNSGSGEAVVASGTGKQLQLAGPKGLALVPGSINTIAVCDSFNHRIVIATLEPSDIQLMNSSFSTESSNSNNNSSGSKSAAAPATMKEAPGKIEGGRLSVQRFSTLAGGNNSASTAAAGSGKASSQSANSNSSSSADDELVWRRSGWVSKKAGILKFPACMLALPQGEGFLVGDATGLRFVSWPEGYIVTLRRIGGKDNGSRGGSSSSKDAPENEASRLQDISALCFDGRGRLLIADSAGGVLRLTPDSQAVQTPRPKEPLESHGPLPWGSRRWIRSQLEVLLLPAAPSPHMRSRDGSLESNGGGTGQGTAVVATGGQVSTHKPAGLCSLEDGEVILVAESHRLRKIFSAECLEAAAIR